MRSGFGTAVLVALGCLSYFSGFLFGRDSAPSPSEGRFSNRSVAAVARRPPTARVVVLSAASGYSRADWERFVLPLRRVYDGPVTVLVDAKEALIWGELVKRFHIDTLPLEQEILVSSGKPDDVASNVKLARYRVGSRVCSAYDWCFFVDFRDVFFQADPFSVLPRLQGVDLALSQEWVGMTIRKCHVNSEWINSCWNASFYDSVADRSIICSGTILATAHGFRVLAEEMAAAYASTRANPKCRARDQGHLLYLFYSGRLERRLPGRVAVHRLGHGVAMTLALAHPGIIREAVLHRQVRNSDGSLVPVAHQFDRWPSLSAMFEWQLQLLRTG